MFTSDIINVTNFLCIFRGFSNTETLCSEYKYYCEQCRSKQEAQKRYVVASRLTLLTRRCFITEAHLLCCFAQFNQIEPDRARWSPYLHVAFSSTLNAFIVLYCISVWVLCTRRGSFILEHFTVTVAFWDCRWNFRFWSVFFYFIQDASKKITHDPCPAPKAL